MDNIAAKTKRAAQFNDTVQLSNKILIDDAALIMTGFVPRIWEKNENTLETIIGQKFKHITRIAAVQPDIL